MEDFGKLDAFTISRIEGALETETAVRLRTVISKVANELYKDGYPSEDIYDYVRGVLIEELNVIYEI